MSNRCESHANDHDTTASRTTTSTKKHARFDKDVEYIEQEEDVAHNPLYGKSHDLFFAYWRRLPESSGCNINCSMNYCGRAGICDKSSSYSEWE